jgi:hypothetical protein
LKRSSYLFHRSKQEHETSYSIMESSNNDCNNNSIRIITIISILLAIILNIDSRSDSQSISSPL